MKSRDLRPFAVEHKHKRRSIAQPPASIWGDAVDHFRARSEPERAVEPDLIRGLHAVPIRVPKPQVSAEVRRVLPDLRPAPIEIAEEVVAIRVKPRRAPRKGGETGLRKPDKQSAHQVEQPSAIVGETDALAGADDTPEVSFTGETRTDIVVSQEPWSGIVHAQEAALQTRTRRVRTWTRKVDDLLRGERWKKRLPEVCR